MPGYKRLPEAAAFKMRPEEWGGGGGDGLEASAGGKVKIKGENVRRGWNHATIGTPDIPNSWLQNFDQLSLFILRAQFDMQWPSFSSYSVLLYSNSSIALHAYQS